MKVSGSVLNGSTANKAVEFDAESSSVDFSEFILYLGCGIGQSFQQRVSPQRSICFERGGESGLLAVELGVVPNILLGHPERFGVAIWPCDFQPQATSSCVPMHSSPFGERLQAAREPCGASNPSPGASVGALGGRELVSILLVTEGLGCLALGGLCYCVELMPFHFSLSLRAYPNHGGSGRGGGESPVRCGCR